MDGALTISNLYNIQQTYTEIEKPPLPTIYQLLPHLSGEQSLRPAYHMASSRTGVEIVIGVPTVSRDSATYFMTTLKYLVKGLSDEEARNTLIIVLVGDTDLEYVIGVANDIRKEFQKPVDSGLIELISPAASYYPDFTKLKPKLRNTLERTAWWTKQNLHCKFLISHAQSRGNYYLMLENDVESKKRYMKDIKSRIKIMSVKYPDWVIIGFCPFGGIGKLFKASQLIHFITYVELFYASMPIDWLIMAYISNKACSINDSKVIQLFLIIDPFVWWPRLFHPE